MIDDTMSSTIAEEDVYYTVNYVNFANAKFRAVQSIKNFALCRTVTKSLVEMKPAAICSSHEDFTLPAANTRFEKPLGIWSVFRH